METWTWSHGHGDMDMETWTWKHGHGNMDMEMNMDMETWAWRHAQEIWVWRYGHGDMKLRYQTCKREIKAQKTVLYLLTVSSKPNWKFFVCPFIDEGTNGSNPFAND